VTTRSRRTASPATATGSATAGASRSDGQDARGARARTSASGTPVSAGSRIADATAARLRRDRAELLSAGVLALALLASLVAWGVLDIGHAAAEPAPAMAGAGPD